ncbi:hypothetical protein LOTGIDRAFT_152462 [Lottia gigantea]|uniref:Fibrinogen C-terminal domain-containing protein n=1 Tax=Lottia gigantea TaxID=225164 RepID=V4CSS9_LOTGI|nr:hypothetical protein LOTGIDRAFT_152462 [Lottia gigantea]ESP05605.1 hypothetical protein LOTGIDRAFT_152462 [Lottia gigantea]
MLSGVSVDVQIKYKICDNKIIKIWKREKEKEAKSLKMCGILCSRLPWCRAITACPAGTGGYNCQFHYGVYFAACQSFRSDLNCKIMIETTKNTEPISAEGCANGGIWNGTNCRCLDGFASPKCERYIKDCEEGADLGYKNKPGQWDYVTTLTWSTGAPYPFETFCNYNDGKTIMFYRGFGVPINWNRTWQEYKYVLTETNEAYWMGLENIHYLTNSGTHQLQIYFTRFADSNLFGQFFYKNFKVGAESTDYQLSYSSLEVVKEPYGLQDGEPDSNTLGPINGSRPFCTWEKPGCSSALQNGGWWHDAFATQYSLTKPMEPVTVHYHGEDVQVNSISFQVYDNSRS